MHVRLVSDFKTFMFNRDFMSSHFSFMAACKTLKSVNARLQVRLVLMTFRVSRRRREMYIGLRVCLSLASLPYYCTDPDVTWEW